MDSDIRKKKSFFLTALNVISCYAVVMLHANGSYWAFTNDRCWRIANIIETFFYFAVPCFLMISGATLMDYEDRYTLKEYFIKRIKKTVIPFIVWSIIGFFVYGHFTDRFNISDYDLKGIYNGIMNTSFVQIYWFFPTLFCIYLAIPLFAAVEKQKRKKVFTYLAVMGYILNALLPFINSNMKLELSLPLNVSSVAGCTIFAVIGYLLYEYDMSPKWRIFVYIAAVAAAVIHAVGTQVVSVEAGETLRTFKGYNNALGVAYSVGVFVLLKQIFLKVELSDKIKAVFKFISKYTFGIYLIHRFILDWFRMQSFIDDRSIVFKLGMPFIVFPISIGVIYILRKIPVLKHIVP